MRALLIMDMQEALLGKNRNKKYTYESEKLIKNINNEICKYDKENIFYVKTINKNNFLNKMLNKKMYETDPNTKLVDKLNIVNKHFIHKESKDAFKNKEFEDKLKKAKIDELQIVGVDTCGSICDSVISGLKKGFKIVLNKSLMESISKEKSEKVCKKMQNKGAKILN